MDEITLRLVTAEAGLNARYVYEEFGGLDGFIRAGYETAVGQFRDHIDGALGADVDETADDVAVIVSAICTFVERQQHKARLIVVDSLKVPALSDRRKQAIDHFTGAFARRLGAQRAYAHIPRDQLALTARFLVGATGEVIVGTIDHSVPGTPTTHVPALTALFTGALSQRSSTAPTD
ncbi:TetR/AcrR family transcriptional regulator [Gordonia lacunae]|uniref:TetR family transcriptional regulator n=1 Tax=Gordonia lacunae TaxID=417102 RepID=A0A243Q449_9ACTN|nr:TetR/AcrR family transcriptional regulator [Gordonia lacunae]OUC76135.1 hypothetical protein CA982_23450 [Gordonia lacunae]